MVKVLFLIHDLGQGGAEKVLVNLVNNMNHKEFDITVMTLFDVGENRQFISDKVHYKSWFPVMVPANSHWMKLFTPQKLHRMIIKDHYDVEVSYLEGPCARVISGCTDPSVKKLCWIHREQGNFNVLARSFRSNNEATKCYFSFDFIACVSEDIKNEIEKMFQHRLDVKKLFNTVDSRSIITMSNEKIDDIYINDHKINLVAVGKLIKNKGVYRLCSIIYNLRKEGYPVHLYLLGEGPERKNIETFVVNNSLYDCITLLGYQANPYKYMSKCDLFVCASYAEGFSTAVTEALILGIPVCTMEVAGMRELLGTNNEFGIIVPNDTESLYKGIKELLDSPELLSYYSDKAIERSKDFIISNTVSAVESYIFSLVGCR